MKDTIIVTEKEFGIHEECGIFGVSSLTKQNLAQDIYYGLFALQHRGQESAGIAVSYEKNRIAYYKNMGLVNDVFGTEELALLPASQTGIGHVRYSTTGSSNVVNAQPVVFYGRYGRLALAHNGNIVNADIIRERMIKAGHIFQSSIDSEVLAALVNHYATDSLLQGITKACEDILGAYAFVIMSEGTLYAVRDTRGMKPLVMGEKDGMILFASESCAIDAVDARVIRDVAPGEIVKVNPDGTTESVFLSNVQKKSCIFEYVYLARSDSVIDNVSVYEARYQCGKLLAELHKIDADIVAGVPDSAIVCARGYSETSGIPYVDALSKNRYVGRSFIQPSQSMRESSVKIKLNAFRSNIKGKRLILIDDSIVRGTTSKKIIKLLRQNGVKEVHMLVASPIVKFPCYFGVDMQTKEQLIGGFQNEEAICAEIGADSLHYIPLELLKSACGCKNDDYCVACFDGNYPYELDEIHCGNHILEN
ncbi:MAG: amidophosphoribosyltransferase [Clostridia bacterium]|nr:amidophosphoribosyltransferase [Clostridia bacterium]